MKNKKTAKTYFILFVLCLMLPGIIAAQGGKHFLLGTGIGYTHTNFLSNSFFDNTQSDIIKKKFGWNIGVYGKKGFFIWDVGYFASYYDINISSLPLPEDVSIRNDGLELGVSMNVLPKFKYLSPLIGIAFQSSSLHTNKSETDQSFQSFSANTSGMVWKAGLLINFTRDVGLLLNYKQSFPEKIEFSSQEILQPKILFIDKDRAIQQISITLLFKLGISYTIQTR